MRNSNQSCDRQPPEWARSIPLAAVRRYPQSGPPPGQTGIPRDAAVLVLLTEEPNGVQVLLTERASGLRAYPGRVSFPGGARDPADADPAKTALREAKEEIGLNPASVHVLGVMPTVADPQGKYMVTPVVAWSASPDWAGPVSSAEVAKVHQVAIRDLSSAKGTGQRSDELAALVSQLGQMTAAIIDAVAALLSNPTPDENNKIHPEQPR